MPTKTLDYSPEPCARTERRCGPYAGLRRSCLYQPLAILLAILLAPAASWIPGGSPGASAAAPFQAHAQLFSCNGGTSNTIIQKYCTPAGSPSPYVNDLIQLESSAVNGYLALHNLPTTDAHIVYDYGRADLRSAIRAYLLGNLITIIQTPVASRNTHQQNVYNWLQQIIQADEIAYYQNANDEYLRWQNDPCRFQLDPTIASAYNLSYDGSAFCGSPLNQLFSGPPVPAESYFTTFGLSKSYAADAATDPNFSKIVAATTKNIGEVVGVSTAAGVLLAALAAGGAGLYASAVASSAAFAAAFAAATPEAVDAAVFAAASSPAYIVAGTTVDVLGAATVVAGPLAILAIAIAIGVSAGMQAFDNQAIINDLNNLQSGLTNAKNNPPNLTAFVTDSSGQGMYKLINALADRTTPEMASTAALPPHQSTDAGFLAQASGGSPQVQTMLSYQDWAGNRWSAQTHGGWFVQTCANGASGTCKQADSINASILYVDWSGTNWIGSRHGNVFVSTKSNPASTDVSCEASLALGVTPPTNFTVCSSYVSNSIQLLDGNGNKVTASIQQLQTPAFLNSNAIVFTPGTASVQTITPSGGPTPTVCLTNGTLNSHISLPGGNCGTGSLQLQFDGSAQAPTGSTPITVSATNLIGSATQTFTVYIATALQFVSPSTLNVTGGLPVNFLVQTSGSPTPTLTDQMNLAGYGLSLHDNGNGTATISGTPGGLIQVCSFNPGFQPCGIYASNGASTIMQNLQINVNAPPSATLVGSRTATFLAGAQNHIVLSSTGAITPVSWLFQADPNAPWLTLKDNGDGTATLSGVPFPDSVGSFTPLIDPVPLGRPGFLSDPFTVNIIHQPVFSPPNKATFTVGTYNQTSVFDSFGNIGLNSFLPSWLSWFFFPSGAQFFPAQGILSGIPPVGSGGQYAIAFSDGSGDLGPASETFTLSVNEAPRIVSPNMAVMFAGRPESINVTTLGYPQLSTKAVSLTSPPTDPTAGDGMYFAVTGLPSSLKASNLDATGFATGSVTISGTPTNADIGVHKVNITATNAVGSPAQQTLTLQVYPYNPMTPVNLVASETFSRDSNNNVVATVIVANGGSATAQDVAITSAKIGALAGTVAPASIASIPAASTAVFTVTFPAASLGVSGAPTTFSLTGSYTGGTFSSAGRMTLP